MCLHRASDESTDVAGVDGNDGLQVGDLPVVAQVGVGDEDGAHSLAALAAMEAPIEAVSSKTVPQTKQGRGVVLE